MESMPASAALIAQAQERMRGTFIELIGLRIIEVTSERAVAEMPFIPQLQQHCCSVVRKGKGPDFTARAMQLLVHWCTTRTVMPASPCL